ncbi:MAG: OmpA family protein [Bacteroidetes bacterium]|jgi:peptidoglycan-associated lipoprotein|nr:OmpA family protein [Bacteroidota bacterium]
MSKTLTSLICLCLLLPALNSCNKGLPYKVADEHGLKKQAIAALEEDYRTSKKPEIKKDLAGKLALLYNSVNNYTKAETYFKEATKEPVLDPLMHYNYAQVLKSRNKYEDAISQLESYAAAVPGDKKVATEILLCQQAIEWEKNPQETRYRVELEKFMSNSKANDYGPVITAEGLVFVSNRTGDKSNKLANATGGENSEWLNGARSDIFIAREQTGKKETSISKPEIMESEGIINTEWSEGPAAFDPGMKLMIYGSCNRPYVQNELNRNDSNCVLMSSTRKGKAWESPSRLEFCKDSSKSIHYGHPCLSEDGQTLYFSSNMAGGLGGYDVWMCTYVKRSNTWSDPINLGPKINTHKDEMYPHIYDNALYFSSNGHPGLGGLDNFVSYGRGVDWSDPKNLMAPMNSSGDDFSIFFQRDQKLTRRTGDYGYFASNRGNTAAIDNIYSFNMVPLNFTVSGYVYDDKTKEIIKNAKVTLTNIDDEAKVFVTTNDLGYYFMKLDGETNYSLRAYKEKYENLQDDPAVSTFDYEVSMDFERDMYLSPMRPVFELDIQYDLDSHVIRPDAAVLLDSFARILKEHYYTEMELSSHTDSRGSDEYNEDLAQRRAEAAVNYLVSKGIERERFVAKGYGEYKPKVIKVEDKEVTLTEAYINQFEKTDKDKFDYLHQQNRRTEIRILSYDYKPKQVVEDEAKSYVDPDEELLKEMEGEEGGEGESEGEGGGK